MAVYKVPQDVEADDKLIGPFSFRQFIYLIVVAISGAGSWGLSTIFIPLAIVPLPFIVFFAVLALPLRKDQPMETYLSAVVSFYFLKSRKRFWQPDGIDSFVTIIPPKDADKILTKQFSEQEATKRLGYLAELVDTHGWSVRGAGVPVPDTSVSSDLYYETQQTPDIMDDNTSQAMALDQKLQASNNNFRQNAIAQMQQTPTPIQPPQSPQQQFGAPGGAPTPTFNPMAHAPAPAPAQSTQSYLGKDQLDAIAYASALTEEAEDARSTPAQTRPATQPQPRTPVVTTPAPITPLPQTPPAMPVSTSETTTPGATMGLAKEHAEELAMRNDISIQTLSEEANRLEKKDKVLKSGEEVTISLR